VSDFVTDIYDPGFVERLFDEMASSYEAVNYVTSIGFSKRWRRQVVSEAVIQPGMVVCDLMCGMGECWNAIALRLGERDELIGVDLSDKMLQGAVKRKAKFARLNIALQKQNALDNTLEDECVDCVICGFGVKTFSEEQKETLAAEIRRILKPQGTFSLIEVSVPSGWILKALYMFYLKHIIPIIGRLLLGNPENYRMLGVYTEKFGNCKTIRDILARQGLRVRYHIYFFGCASGVSGVKVA
jgi:ubiquinone/menaquinone biosynthesis methyltransferase